MCVGVLQDGEVDFLQFLFRVPVHLPKTSGIGLPCPIINGIKILGKAK